MVFEVTAITAMCERAWYSRFARRKRRRKEALSSQHSAKTKGAAHRSAFQI
jgi:hypothetical protein